MNGAVPTAILRLRNRELLVKLIQSTRQVYCGIQIEKKGLIPFLPLQPLRNGIESLVVSTKKSLRLISPSTSTRMLLLVGVVCSRLPWPGARPGGPQHLRSQLEHGHERGPFLHDGPDGQLRVRRHSLRLRHKRHVDVLLRSVLPAVSGPGGQPDQHVCAARSTG